MKILDYIALTLVIIGAINWGLVGFFNFDLVTAIFHGGAVWVARIIFALVGIAGLYGLSLYSRMDEETKTATQK